MSEELGLSLMRMYVVIATGAGCVAFVAWIYSMVRDLLKL